MFLSIVMTLLMMQFQRIILVFWPGEIVALPTALQAFGTRKAAEIRNGEHSQLWQEQTLLLFLSTCLTSEQPQYCCEKCLSKKVSEQGYHRCACQGGTTTG